MKWVAFIICVSSFGSSSQGILNEGKGMRNYAASPLIIAAGNPAALSAAKSPSVTVAGSKAFMIIPAADLNIALPVLNGGFGFRINSSGVPDHKELDLSIAYAKKLGEQFSAGLRFVCNRRSIPGHWQGANAGFEGGFILRLTREIITGMDIRHYIVTQGELKLPGSFHAGIGYNPSELVFIAAEVSKEDLHSPDLRLLVDYWLRTDVFTSVSFITANDEWMFSTGYKFRALLIEVTFAFHPYLGWSPSLSLTFQKKKNEKQR